jgi:hypothetical protein
MLSKAQGKLDQLEAQRKLVQKDDGYQIKLLDIEYGLLCARLYCLHSLHCYF